MTARRSPIVLAGGLALVWAASLSIAPVAAATCALSAPAAAQVGDSVVVLGSGFPASTNIDIAISLDGASIDAFAVQSDGGGAFQISLTPEAADIGTTSVVATAGTTCSATAVYVVSAAGPSAQPAASPTTAGRPPRTDTAAAAAALRPGLSAGSLSLGILIIALGLGGLLGARRLVRD